MNMKCAICGSDKFHLDIENQTVSCSACSFYCDFKALVRGNAASQAQPAPQRPAYNPADFEIVSGVLKKYKGAAVDVVVPDGVLEIGEKAFAGHEYIQTVTLPFGLSKIQLGAFDGCKRMKTINLPDTLEMICEAAFAGCESLKDFIIPRGVEGIGGRAFSGCISLTNVTLPNTLKHIGEYAFNGCKSLKNITLPDGLEFIGNRAFYDCSSLERIEIPDTVDTIANEYHEWWTRSWHEDHCFDKCDKLAVIIYPQKRFKLQQFYGSLYYRQQPAGRRDLVHKKICPDCLGHLGMFKKCQKCGKMW